MASPLTPKQETFCLKWIESGNASEAVLLAGYKTKNAKVIGAQNLTKLNIQARIAELREETKDATVATVIERKQILTEIARANLTDFVDESGNITLEAPHKAAIVELAVEDWKGGQDEQVISSRTKRIKLHNPIHAIGELNKMDGAYAPEKHAHLLKIGLGDLTDEELVAIVTNRDNASGGSKRITQEASGS